jgi:hypothetical protein
MREIRTSGSMSGDGKRSVAAWPKLTAPILDSAFAAFHDVCSNVGNREISGLVMLKLSFVDVDSML